MDNKITLRQEINQRILNALDYIILTTGKTKAALAQDMHMSKQAMSEIFAKRAMAGTDIIYSLCKNYNICADWIVMGDGSMQLDTVDPSIDGDISVVDDDIKMALKGADYLTTMAGSTMSPTLLSGDVIACRRMPSDGIIQWGKIYLVDIGQGQPLIRRIRPGSSSDAVILASDNPSYDPIDLPRSGIVSLALVIGFIRVD